MRKIEIKIALGELEEVEVGGGSIDAAAQRRSFSAVRPCVPEGFTEPVSNWGLKDEWAIL